MASFDNGGFGSVRCGGRVYECLNFMDFRKEEYRWRQQ
jgi:hypothetical protein